MAELSLTDFYPKDERLLSINTLNSEFFIKVLQPMKDWQSMFEGLSKRPLWITVKGKGVGGAGGMFSFLSASHSTSPYLALENCEDLAFFLFNGFLKAKPWFSSTVIADLMGYYSCSKTGSRAIKITRLWKPLCEKVVTCLTKKWEKEENEKYEYIFTFLSFFQLQWSALISMKMWVDRLTCLTCWASSSCWERTYNHLLVVQIVF